jgi:hypothetical protein
VLVCISATTTAVFFVRGGGAYTDERVDVVAPKDHNILI